MSEGNCGITVREVGQWPVQNGDMDSNDAPLIANSGAFAERPRRIPDHLQGSKCLVDVSVTRIASRRPLARLRAESLLTLGTPVIQFQQTVWADAVAAPTPCGALPCGTPGSWSSPP